MKLLAEHLEFSYGRNPVLHELSLELPDRGVLAIIGPNGGGKSTLLKCLGGLLRPSGGSCRLDGRDLRSWPRLELARVLAVLGQFNSAPPELTVRELVGFGRYPHRTGRERDREAVELALTECGAAALADRRLGTLSGGERQRAWLALALAQEPRVLLLDEPTTFLDPRGQLEIISLIGELNRRLGITIGVVLHDLNHAAGCADRVAAISGGRLAFSGTPEELLRPETIRGIFGVDGAVLTAPDGSRFFAPLACSKPAN